MGLDARLSASGAALVKPFGRVGADPADSEEMRLRKALLVFVSVLILPVSLVWGSLYLALGSPVGVVPFVYFGVSVGAIAIFARTHDFDFLLRVELLDILLTTTLSAVPMGGFSASSGVGMWGILAPLGALVFADIRAGVRWFAAFVTVFLAAGIAGELLHIEPPLPGWFNSVMLGLNVVVSSAIVFTLLAVFANQLQAALAALRTEQARSDSLLLNLLPRTIATRLKEEQQTIADQFDSASVLFADVVGFTPFAERNPPARVVETLDRLFTTFDMLAERHGVEKIKTIGDAYMVAAGVPTPREDHAAAIARMALDVLDAARSDEGARKHGLHLRVGISSGPVVAGVIGRKRLLYDLWGDAVNTASRMQSQGEPGRIQISRSTYELIKDDFVCEPRGSVAVKGKGEMDTWYLTGIRQAARPAPAGSPVPPAGLVPGRVPVPPTGLRRSPD